MEAAVSRTNSAIAPKTPARRTGGFGVKPRKDFVPAYKPYILAERQRIAEQQRALDERRAAAVASARELAGLLAARHGARKVYLFGSTTNSLFSSESDIDLGVLGIRPEQFFKAWADVNARSWAPVDLVALESAPETLRNRILDEGKLIYERPGTAHRRAPKTSS